MIENLVGLNVENDQVYADYRDAMRPLLEKHEGGFRYDFSIEKTLISETEGKINRLFIIYFGSEELQNSFFSHPEYIKIKDKFFEKSVVSTTIISSYKRE